MAPPAPRGGSTGKGGVASLAETFRENKSILRGVGFIYVTSFAFVIGQSCFTTFFPLLYAQRWGASAAEIGIISSKVAVFCLAMQTMLYSHIERRIGVERTAMLGAGGILVGLSCIGALQSHSGLLAAALTYGAGTCFFGPLVPTLIARLVPPDRRGLALGMDSMVNNFGRVLAPWFLGSIYAAHGPAFCFAAGGWSVAMAAVVLRFFVI